MQDRADAASPEAFLDLRSRELAEIEAAALVLSPILTDEDLRDYNERFEALHERIDKLSALLTGTSDDVALLAERAAAEFAEVGSALSALLEHTRARLPEADLAKLRPAVRQFCTTHRGDVEAVLDLCLRNLDAFEDFWPLMDLIIGRLCASSSDGAELAVEPHHLTPRLAEVCGETCELFPGATAQAAGVFRRAIEDVEAARELPDLEPILERVFKHKQSLGRKILLPAVLRSSVLYNLAITRAVETLHRPADAPAPESASAAADEPPARPVRSVFEHEGVDEIDGALVARLTGARSEAASAARVIAAGCDLSQLETADRAALVGSPLDCEVPAYRRMLLVGLVLSQLPRIQGELEHLDIDVDEFADEWVPEVRRAIRTQTRELIRAGRYTETRTACEALSRLLPIWATSERARILGAKREAVYTVATDEIDLRALIDAYNDDRRTKRVIGFRHVLAASLLMIAIVSVGRVVIGPYTSVELLEPQELAALSTHLEAGQRSENGYGDAMAGTLGASWDVLDDEEKFRTASRLAADLRKNGILNAVLLDSDRRLEVKIAGGRLIYPERP